MQCGKHSEDPELRRYETPPEALYDLAERFQKEGDLPARRATLEYIVERYPNSRFAVMAKEELERATPADGDH
jgi:TolA-binding protein